MDLVSPAGTLKLSEKTVHQPVELSSAPMIPAELLTAANHRFGNFDFYGSGNFFGSNGYGLRTGFGRNGREMEFGVVYYSCASVGISSRYSNPSGRNASVRSVIVSVAAEV